MTYKSIFTHCDKGEQHISEDNYQRYRNYLKTLISVFEYRSGPEAGFTFNHRESSAVVAHLR